MMGNKQDKSKQDSDTEDYVVRTDARKVLSQPRIQKALIGTDGYAPEAVGLMFGLNVRKCCGQYVGPGNPCLNTTHY